jgi:hypothetical protein
MPSLARRSALLPLVGAAILAMPLRATAQRNLSLQVNADDSIAWVVLRQPLESASAALRTRDRTTALLLTDQAVILQLTDRGLEGVTSQVSEERGLGARLVARMVGAGVAEMLDHGIAYRLSALRSARADGHRLILEDRNGNRVFGTVEMNGRHPMDDFIPSEAQAFAARLNRAIRGR